MWHCHVFQMRRIMAHREVLVRRSSGLLRVGVHEPLRCKMPALPGGNEEGRRMQPYDVLAMLEPLVLGLSRKAF